MGDFIIKILNWIIRALGSIANGFLSILPDSPFNSLMSLDNKYLEWVNFICPVSQIVTTLELWVVAVGVYYTIQVVLRWVKAIE